MSLKNWSRIGAATLVGGMVVLGVANPAYAAAGDADGTALDLTLDATVAGVQLIDVNATLATATAPPDEDSGVIDLTTALTGLGIAVTDGTATASATSDPLSSVGTSSVEDLALSVLGLPISATTISGTATCPPVGGTPVADTSVSGLNVLGFPVDSTVGANIAVPVTLPLATGATGATLRAVVAPSTETVTATTADATALTITLTLDAVVPDVPLVTVNVGTITLGNASCESPAALAVPTAASLSPTSGPDQGGTTVTVTGTDFVVGQTTVSIGTDTSVPATVTNPTTLTFVTPGDPAGPAQVRVVTPGGTSGPLDFAYVGDPTLTGITPNTGPVAGGTTVTLTGANFVAGATTVSIDGVVVPAVVTSATTLTLVTSAHPAGLVAVIAATPSGTSGPLGFTYLGAPVIGAPTATAIDPATGPTTGGTTVTVDGTGFVPGTTVTVDGVSATAVTVTSPTELTFVTPAGAAGLADVVLTTPAGSAPPLGFTYVAAPAAAATSLTPAVGPTTGGTTVTVTGSGFVAGQTTVTIGGTVVPANAVTVTSPTSLTFITPAHAAAGAVQVTVMVPAGTSAPLGFTYQAVAPTATGLTPGSGPTNGGTTVTVDGTGFTPGTTVTIDGVRVPVTVSSPTRLTFVTPAHAAGTVTVAIGTDGGSASLTFSYVASSGSLATTGFDAAVPLVGGLSVLLAGAGLLLTGRRRRSRG